MSPRFLLLSFCLASFLCKTPVSSPSDSFFSFDIQKITQSGEKRIGGGKLAPGRTLRSAAGRPVLTAPDPVIKGAMRRHTSTEIICLLLAILSTGTTIVCIYRMRRMENRFRSFRAEQDPAAKKKPSGDGLTTTGNGTAVNVENMPENPGEAYAPYESNAMDYDRIFMERLDALIAENIANNDMDVDFLAGKMMISRSLLFNHVKRISGVSVTKYVNQFRIDRSVELLAKPYLSLTEIAESTGFSTLRYYSRVFKSIKGEIPSVYRERMFGQSV